MGKKEGCNKMSKKTHFVTAPFYTIYLYYGSTSCYTVMKHIQMVYSV